MAQGGSWAAGVELERREEALKAEHKAEEVSSALDEVGNLLDEIEERCDEIDDRRVDALLVEFKDLVGSLRAGYPRQQ